MEINESIMALHVPPWKTVEPDVPAVGTARFLEFHINER